MTADLPAVDVTVDEAARLVRVSRRTIYNWLKAGKLRYTRTAGGRIRIDSGSLWSETPHAASPAA